MKIVLTDRRATFDGSHVSLDEFIDLAAPSPIDTGNIIIPNGVRCIAEEDGAIAIVHETPPKMHNVVWGNRGESYCTYSIALPYVVMIPVLIRVCNSYRLSYTLCYFRNEPLTSLDDSLFKPHLKNTYRLDDTHLCVMCQPYEKWVNHTNLNKAIQNAVALVANISSSAFNDDVRYCYFYMNDICRSVNDIERWQAHSLRNPKFITSVKWNKASGPLRYVIARALKHTRKECGGSGIAVTFDSLHRIIYNHQ